MLVNNKNNPCFVSEFATHLYHLAPKTPFSDYVFLCIGSDKVIGDSFGPLVGQQLQEFLQNKYQNIHIYGTLEHPVSAINLEDILKQIEEQYKHPCIIAIDSALSIKEDIGSIIVSDQKMLCAKGFHKKSIWVGDISIKGVVAKDQKVSRLNFASLQNMSLGPVMKLADQTAKGIYDAIKYR